MERGGMMGSTVYYDLIPKKLLDGVDKTTCQYINCYNDFDCSRRYNDWHNFFEYCREIAEEVINNQFIIINPSSLNEEIKKKIKSFDVSEPYTLWDEIFDTSDFEKLKSYLPEEYQDINKWRIVICI